MRKLQSEIPTLETLGLPPVFHEIIKEKAGIIFVTGATGSGKTTTLAAMLNELNQTQPIHFALNETASSTRWFRRPSSNLGCNAFSSSNCFHEIGNGVGETWFVTDDVTRQPPLVDVRMSWLGYEGVAVAI